MTESEILARLDAQGARLEALEVAAGVPSPVPENIKLNGAHLVISGDGGRPDQYRGYAETIALLVDKGKPEPGYTNPWAIVKGLAAGLTPEQIAGWYIATVGNYFGGSWAKAHGPHGANWRLTDKTIAALLRGETPEPPWAD